MAGANLTEMIKLKLAYASERQKVLAQNIANIDTPGFKAQDLKPLQFKNVLAEQSAHINLQTTSAMHMNGNKPISSAFRKEESRNTFERNPTGNTVVLEEQMMKVSQNATDYQMTTSLYKKVGNLFRQALGLTPSG